MYYSMQKGPRWRTNLLQSELDDPQLDPNPALCPVAKCTYHGSLQLSANPGQWAMRPRFPVLVPMGLFNTVSLPSGDPSSSPARLHQLQNPTSPSIPSQPLLLHLPTFASLQTTWEVLVDSRHSLCFYSIVSFARPVAKDQQ